MNEDERKELEKECQKLLAPLFQRSRVPAGMRPVIKIALSFEKVHIDPLVAIDVEKDMRWVPTDQPFTDEEFRELLELPLSSYDREFVELFRKRKNKPLMVGEWVRMGFAEQGRIASINRTCRQHGLMLGFRKVAGTYAWWDTPHRFFIMQAVQ